MGFDLDELRRRLPSAKQIASDLYDVEWRRDKARCPRSENHAHGDRDPSFGYLQKVDRVQCFSQLCFGDKPVDAFELVQQMDGCNFQEAAQKLADRYGGVTQQSKPKGPNQKAKLSSRDELQQQGWHEIAVYSMGDGVRKVRFEHPARIQPDKNRPEKTFLWEHQNKDGTWRPGRGSRPHFAYGNTLFRDRDQLDSVLGVESERSADTAGQLGIPAFSFKEVTAQNAMQFAGLDVVLLPDKDEAGVRLLRDKTELLQRHARSIATVEAPGDWPEAGDLHDAIAERGWNRAQVDSLLASRRKLDTAAPPSEKPPPLAKPTFKIWSLDALRRADFPQPAPIVEDLVAEGETVGLIGKPKAGKSRFAQQLALAISRGQSFLGHTVSRARRVLILDLENRPAGVRVRFAKMSEPSAGDEQLFIYAPETLSNMGITLATPDGIKALQRLVAEVKPDLLIIDTWRLILGGDENKTDIVVRALRALSSLRLQFPALAIVIVHHTRKTQGQDPPLLRIDPSAWVESASGHNAWLSHVDACYGLEREIDRKTADELIVFGGVARSVAPRTLLLDEDPDTLVFRTADSADIIQKLLTEKERIAWQAIQNMAQFTFGEAVERAQTKNRKLIASLLRKMTSMKELERGPDGIYCRPTTARN